MITFDDLWIESRPTHLVTGPEWNSHFCFPIISMFPSTSSRGNIVILGKTKLFAKGSEMKYFVIELEFGVKLQGKGKSK